MTTRIRPLCRGGAGVWDSHDGRWTFLRHFSDPHPQRWFAYLRDDDEVDDRDPVFADGHRSLRAAAEAAQRFDKRL